MRWWSRKNGWASYLIRTLDESDGQLRTERHHGAAPSLTCGRVSKVIRLEVLSRSEEKPLCSLAVYVQATTAESKQITEPSIKRPYTRDTSPC